MDLKKDFHTMFELKATEAGSKVKGGVLLRGRYLLGRNESCDLIINSDSISAVHAVFEIFEDHAVLYDMNSTNGTWVEDERIVRREILLDQIFRLADIEFQFRKYVPEKAEAPVLESLEPEHGSASILPSAPKELPKGAPSVSDFNPAIVHPLASDPKAEFSEYIFENREDLYPIFRYEIARQVIEVIILFKDRVFSIDYLDGKAGVYQLAGQLSAENQIELPAIPKNKVHNLIEFLPSGITVNTLPGFGIFHLSDSRKDSGHQVTSVELQSQDIIRLDGGDIQLFIRQVQAPPEVAAGPFIPKNPQLKKNLTMSLSTMALLVLSLIWAKPWFNSPSLDHATERVVTIENRIQLLQQGLTGKFLPARIHATNFSAFDSHDYSGFKGSLELPTVKQVLHEQSHRFRDCDFDGETKLSFTIGPSGHVSETTEIGRSGLSSSALRCLKQALKSVVFPVPAGENEVLVSQVFRSTSK